MRTLIYSLLNGYSSSGRMNKVIQDIAQVTGMSVTVHDISSRSTIERMQLELGVINDIQVIVHFYLIFYIHIVSIAIFNYLYLFFL